MSSYTFDRIINSETDVFEMYRDAIEYRFRHKDQSRQIALHCFDITRSNNGVKYSADIERLRYEMGALEAPGMPEDDNLDPDEYDDRLWSRLRYLTELIIRKRTV